MPNKIKTDDEFSGEDVSMKMFQMWKYLKASRIYFKKQIYVCVRARSIAISRIIMNWDFYEPLTNLS